MSLYRYWSRSGWIIGRSVDRKGIFSRAGVAIPRSTLAQWVGQCDVQLQPLVDALRALMLERPETPVSMLVPGKGKTHRAYV